ncbi:hypothetical protein [uncultured Alistipes sp.]|uniref:hypothetical protein n=1 Tax=uncultured Alistipes sp. TaxID=538949 RepID=UPI002595DD20|nr:hypothetical protein [uncultured Alistipes sp.]
MKNVVKKCFAAALLLSVIGGGSCNKDQEVAKFDPSGENSELAYFSNAEVEASFDRSAQGVQTVEINLLRQNAAGEFTVALSTSGDVDLIGVPETVTFKDGEYQVPIVLECSSEEFAMGVNYAVTITVVNPEVDSETQSSNQIGTKHVVLEFRASLALAWQPCYVLKDFSKLLSDDLTKDDYVLGADGTPVLQGGVYTFNFWWEGENDKQKLERAVDTNTFRLTNWSKGVDLVFSIDPSKTVTVDGKEYVSIVVSKQYIGSDHSDYGKVYVCDGQTFNPNKYPASTYPSYWDGGQTFVFHLMYFVSAGTFGDPARETFVMADGK